MKDVLNFNTLGKYQRVILVCYIRDLCLVSLEPQY